MKDIFVSYSREDRDWVERFVGVLQAEGVSVWWDRTIPPGRTWDEVIEEALEGARCVIVVWSRTSVKSKWVKTEAAEGERRGILLPVFLDDAVAPLEFRRVQGAQLAGWDGSAGNPEFRLLMRSLRAILEGRSAEAGQASGAFQGAASPAAPSPPPPGPQPPAAPPTGPGRSHMPRFLVGLAVTLAMVAALLWVFREPPFDRGALRLGILMKDNWTDRDARQVYDAFRTHLGERLAAIDLGVAEEIRLFRKPDDVIGALAAREIEIAGELSPRGIYQAAEAAGAEPLVSPLYGGSHHYTSVFFVAREYVERNGLDPGARQDIWERVITDLSDGEGNHAAALSDPTSTSGYWYPRYEILRALRGTRPFDSIAIERTTYEDLFAAVGRGYNGAIVGAVAAFRFCDPRYTGHESREACQREFIRLDDTSQIPQGGFVASRDLYAALAREETLQRLQNAWKAAVARAHQDPAVGDLARSYLPETWAGVSQEDYAKAREVFAAPDAAAARASRLSQRLILTGVGIILAVSAVFLWLRRPGPSPGAG